MIPVEPLTKWVKSFSRKKITPCWDSIPVASGPTLENETKFIGDLDRSATQPIARFTKIVRFYFFWQLSNVFFFFSRHSWRFFSKLLNNSCQTFDLSLFGRKYSLKLRNTVKLDVMPQRNLWIDKVFRIFCNRSIHRMDDSSNGISCTVLLISFIYIGRFWPISRHIGRFTFLFKPDQT